MKPINTSISRFASLLAVLMALVCATAVRAQTINPGTQITLPAKDQTLRGTTTIQGTATSTTFSRYELAYAQEPDLATWISLGGAVQPVDNGQLGVWNTRPLADGNYALRLQVFGTDGTVSETIIREITLVNASAPAPEASGVVTDTTQGPAVVSEVQTARDTLQVIGDTLGELPGAFVRGGRLALIALAALGTYALLKKILFFVLPKIFKRRVDYGR